jgi:hypothetical protein
MKVSGVSVQVSGFCDSPFLTPLAQTEHCMNLEYRSILGSLAADSENPSYRNRAGRNLTPDTYT